jgi:hypothetical protein
VRPEEIRPLSIRSEVRSSTQRPETTNRRSLLSRAISNSLWISQLLTNIERPERLERLGTTGTSSAYKRLERFERLELLERLSR